MIRGYVKGQSQLIEKQKYSSVGAEPFFLIAYRDPALFLRRGLTIYTSENYVLKFDTDWEYHTQDVLYSSDDFVNEPVASTLRIKNPAYQNTNLYITWIWVADYVSDEMLNRFDRGLDQMINSVITENNTQVVLDNDGNVIARGELYPGYRQQLL